MGQMFNTLAIMELLVDSGIDEKHSKAIVSAMEKAIDSETIATKSDIRELKTYLDLALTKQTIAFGGMMIVGIGILGAVIKFV